MKLTNREIELIDGMIEVQQRHADQCLRMMDDPHGNSTIAVRQLEWDNERIELLKKIKQELT
jgi:hypothetical protein